MGWVYAVAHLRLSSLVLFVSKSSNRAETRSSSHGQIHHGRDLRTPDEFRFVCKAHARSPAVASTLWRLVCRQPVQRPAGRPAGGFAALRLLPALLRIWLP
ncbi:hypothetical protein HPB47_020544 [Ixodes persulcatus]|uniref:Uncharacterized protein n=1 Tax=Ixodes persulcatus TaxID=34615 RepID=A0AC60QIC8_IXOPE|nr:hypothetical protein HPB47_020544 [Ixodes persulcatus]